MSTTKKRDPNTRVKAISDCYWNGRFYERGHELSVGQVEGCKYFHDADHFEAAIEAHEKNRLDDFLKESYPADAFGLPPKVKAKVDQEEEIERLRRENAELRAANAPKGKKEKEDPDTKALTEEILAKQKAQKEQEAAGNQNNGSQGPTETVAANTATGQGNIPPF